MYRALQVISQLHPDHESLDAEHELAVDSILDGQHAVVLAERRRHVDASPIARWIDQRMMVRRVCGRGRPGRSG
jgi:hypothetical protein